jgi:signal transduction histidine kinase
MAAHAAPLRRLVTESFRVPDIAGRVGRWLTIAIDRAQADAQAEEAETRHLPLESRLRLATFFALACGVLFLPLDGSQVTRDVLASLLLLYCFHAVLTSFVLIASFTARGKRHADQLALLLVVGHAVNLHVYLWVWPKYPGLAAGILACLLMGNSVLFSWSTGRVLALAIAFCGGFLAIGTGERPLDFQRPDFLVAAVLLVVGAATAVGCARLLAVLRTSLAHRQRELSELSARLMAAQEEERRRLARDLHDEFGQALTAVNAHLWLIERQPAEESVTRNRAAEARRLVNRTISAMRELSQLLRPSVLDALGLAPSLDGLLKSFGERHEVKTSLTSDGLPERLPVEIETALYRITQEALTNVARHSRAKRVRVALAALGGDIRLEIEDDGVGLPARNGTEPQSGTGLIGIRERVRAIGGELTITSRKGLRLAVQVPLPA